MPELIVLSGPPGAGKSTIGRALAERRDRCVVLERDAFYGFIAAGFVPPWLPEAETQDQVSLRACVAAARAYLDYCDVVLAGALEPQSLRALLTQLRPISIPIHFIRLVPERDAAVRRPVARSRNLRLGISKQHYGCMFDQYVAHGACAGVALDSTELTLGGTVSRVEALLSTGEALLSDTEWITGDDL